MKNLFIDIKTTGLDPQNHGIIQLSGIIEIDKEAKDTFNYFIRPFSGISDYSGFQFPYKIKKLTKLLHCLVGKTKR